MKRTTTWTHIGLAIVSIITLALLGGCTDLQGALSQASDWRNNAQGIQTEIQTQLDALELQRQVIPDTSSDAQYLDAAIALASAKIQSLNAAIAQADLVIEEATYPTDPLTRAADAIAPWVPAPAQGPMLLGAALIASLARSRNLKNSARSIINSIDHLIGRDPQFKELFALHANTIRTIQTPGAKKLVDSVSRKSIKAPALLAR